MTMNVLMMLVALGLLVLGAEWLVRGASRLAARFGVSRLLIGLTVVAFGTSAPELAVSLDSSVTGRVDLAVGNVIGSNIFNILCVLGLTALVTRVAISAKIVRIDIPILLAVSLLFLVLAIDGQVSRFDGLLLFAGSVAYTAFSVRLSRAEPRTDDATATPGGRLWVEVGLIVVGLGLLVLGAHWFVEGAVELARTLGVSELVIGLTIVAVGTSLPEVATSVVAAVRGEPDLMVGNVVGSCLLNLLCIVGASALFADGGLSVSPSVLAFDLPIMIGATFALLPIAGVRSSLARWEGLFFLLCYATYTACLFLRATQHDAKPLFDTVLIGFVLPLVAVTLVVLYAQGLERRAEK